MKIFLKLSILFLLLTMHISIYGQSDDKLYIIVEHQPEFPNGQAALFKYLAHNVKIKQDSTGIDCASILVKFIVEKDGHTVYENCRYLNCKSECPVEEMKELIENMPKWKPGRQNGKVVRVSYSIPIKVRIE